MDNQGARIVMHAFRLVFRNLGDALKVSVGPYVIGMVIAALAMMLVGASPEAFLTGDVVAISSDPAAMAAQSLGSMLGALVMLFISSWVAVAWHRFVLLEEYPGLLPALSGRPVWPYLGRAVQLALLLIIIAIPVVVVVAGFLAPMIGDPTVEPGAGMGVAALGLALVLATLFTWLSIRFGLVLPATALGRKLGFRESWRTSAPMSGAILIAILILVALNLAVSVVIGAVFRGTVIFGVLDLVVNWISLMVGLSILTTIYGHMVEGRPLT